MPRSGTNFLATLLDKHPDCVQSPAGIWEDHLMRHSELLTNYAENTARSWNNKWGKSGSDLLNSLGVGLMTLLGASDERTLITKTPFADGIQNLSSLIPHSRIILILRNPKAMIESGIRSLNWNFEKALLEYRKRARSYLEIRQMLDAVEIRFEDLVQDTLGTLQRMAGQLGIEGQSFTQEMLIDHPVYGSSDEGMDVSWEGADAHQGFNPLNRALEWKPAMERRFDWVAGKESSALGYSGENKFKALDVLRESLLDLLK